MENAMGLDMYLRTNSKRLADELRADGEWGDYCAKYGYVMYWRKANAIHRWFVENVQEGEDDCREYEVSIGQLRELKAKCDEVIEGCKLVPGKVCVGRKLLPSGEFENEMVDGQVLDNQRLAEDTLPTMKGFFFGDIEYDEWYLHDLRYTSKMIQEVIDRTVGDDYDATHVDDPDWHVTFHYHSSW